MPKTIPTRVRAERSLWLQISAAEVPAASPISTLLVPRSLDGVEAGGADRGVEPEEDLDRHREDEAEEHILGRHHHRLLDEAADRVREADSEPETEEAPTIVTTTLSTRKLAWLKSWKSCTPPWARRKIAFATLRGFVHVPIDPLALHLLLEAQRHLLHLRVLQE